MDPKQCLFLFLLSELAWCSISLQCKDLMCSIVCGVKGPWPLPGLYAPSLELRSSNSSSNISSISTNSTSNSNKSDTLVQIRLNQLKSI